VSARAWGRKLSATVLGLGYLPIAPGTWSSAGAALVYMGIMQAPTVLAIGALMLLTAFSLLIGVRVCPWAEEYFGAKDPSAFVLDEASGYWLGCLLFWWRGPVYSAVAVFFAFRFFDIVKPFPVGQLEQLPGGWGVMLDDLGAAVYSALLLWPVCYLVVDPFLGA